MPENIGTGTARPKVPGAGPARASEKGLPTDMDILPITGIGGTVMTNEAKASERHPVFFQIPLNWDEMTEEQQHGWALGFLQAAIGAAGEEAEKEPSDATPERT
jgi:hypothetical protein